MITSRLHSLYFFLGFTLPALAWAQEAAAPVAPASAVQSVPPMLIQTATSAPIPVAEETPAAEAASAPLAETAPPIAAPLPEGCRPLTIKAMAADVKAFSARTRKAELAEQSAAFEEAVTLWSQAEAQCEGRDREQARRNLTDSRRVLDGIAEQLGAGPQCTAAHKDAGSLQEMARQALGERRWGDASMLFNKAENMWGMAAELCTGSQRELARRHREESGIDGHNAEFCAPIFEKAREQMQKLRSASAMLTREEKHDISMLAETWWREALTQCKGAAVQDIARNNAQSLARERGTPWVAQAPPVVQQTVPRDSHNSAATSGQGAPLREAAVKEAAPRQTAGVSVVAPLVLPPPAAPVVAPQVQQKPADVAARVEPASAVTAAVAAPTRMTASDAMIVQGSQVRRSEIRPVTVFNADEDARRLNGYTGAAKVLWSSGDVYEGDLVKGIRQGRGAFLWANGQSYHGDWNNDIAVGQGIIKFANGNRYEGAVVGGVPQGQGRTQFASGDSYTGNFVNGERDGLGEYLWLNGDKYIGQWKSGKKHGQGTLILLNGERWNVSYEQDYEVSRLPPGERESKPAESEIKPSSP